ncbi:MAG: hypothetical protein F7C35_02010 [Desulfurococcales archaeon]|nr:hypothetical protein [Desulfurococcales archaeon]
MRRYRLTAPILAVALLAATKVIVLLSAGALTGRITLEDFALRWDGGHYIRLAEKGYHGEADYAFPPLYPITIRILAATGIPPWASALIVSNIASFFLLAGLSRVSGWRTALLVMTFPPLLLYTTTAYSEALALSLTVWGVAYYIRGRTWRAGILIALGEIARYSMALAGLGLILHLLISRRGKGILGLITPQALAVALVLAFFTVQAGTPLAYFKAEKHWGAGLVSPAEQAEWLLHGPITYQFSLLNGIPTPPGVFLFRNYLFILAYTLGAILLAARRRWALLAAGLPGLIVLPLLGGVPSISVPRIALHSITLLIPLGEPKASTATTLYAAAGICGNVVATVWHYTSFFA